MLKRSKYLFIIVLSLMVSLFGCSYLVPQPAPSKTPSVPFGSLPILPNIADVVDIVEHSVVAIDTQSVTTDVFNRTRLHESSGSGWIIDENGTIVTNYHVVEGATSITVTLRDNRVLTAEIAGSDSYADLAIISLSNAGKLPPARVGDSTKLRVGDWVVALGNSLGLGISAKEGIISRLGVSMEVSAGQVLHDLIETSAAINQGNSGGPLVNMSAEVIGITSLKIGNLGVEGMGYAISVNNAIPVVQELVAAGCVIRPWLGASLVTVDQTIANRYRLSVNRGVYLTEIPPGSPAEKAGLEVGDVIVIFEGTDINTAPQLTRAVYASRVGQGVNIVYYRGSSINSTTAVLVESPPCF